MAFESFNSVGGYTVGIPPVPVINDSGSFISNVVTSGNVVANVIRGTTFLFANGSPLTATAAGSNFQVQFNTNGLFAASSGLVFTPNTSLLTVSNLSVTGLTDLGDLGNITINGGDAGYVLSTDGLGTLSWVQQTGGGGNGSPGGGNAAVQFNDQDAFGGNSYFTFNKTTGVLTANNIVATNSFTGVLATANQPNITSVGTLTSLQVSGTTTSTLFSGNGAGLSNIAGANVTGVVSAAAVATIATLAGTVTSNYQPNITAVGILSNLSVSGSANLGNVGNVKIAGGYPGQVLSTDGFGNLNWTAGGGGGNGTPGGINTEVQFNDAGNFGGNVNLTFNKTTGTLNATLFAGSGANLTNIPASNVVGTVSNATYALSAASANTAISAGSAGTAGTVTTGAQPNITSVGTLTGLSVTGSANLGNISNLYIGGGSANYVLATDGLGNLSWKAGGGGGNPGGTNTQVQFNNENSFGGNASFTFNNTTGVMQVPYIVSNGGNLTNLNGANVSGTVANATYATNSGTAIVASLAGSVTNPNQSNITSVGTLSNLTVSGNAVLGNIANVKITGGAANYYLQTDGTGNLSWVPGGGGGGNPGGANTQVQFNSNGTFAGSAYLTYDNTAHVLQVAGDLVANAVTIGSGAYKFSRMSVYFATSVSASETLLMTFPTANTAGLDFTIISTDATAGNRQICKLEAVYYANTVHYNEYSTIQVNGPVGNFAVTYDAGDIINPARASLYVYPTTSNMTTYKIQVTAYEE